ncbi:uncharacterized protein ACRADG_013265 [Cochliomyia hominivorax]
MDFMEKLKINQCRTCYNSTKTLKLLTDLTKCSGNQQISFAELLTDVCNINPIEDYYNELPQYICEACSRKLKSAQAFIQQTHEVNERLLEMLTNQKKADDNILNCLEDAPVQVKMEFDESVTESESQHDTEAEYVTDNKSLKTNNKAQNKEISSSNMIQLLGLLNKKLDLLTQNNEILKNQIKDIKNQNILVLDVLTENTDAIEKSINKNPKYIKMFPIKTRQELEDIEESINEQNEKEFICSIRAIAGYRGLKKGLADIMTPRLLVDFNVDGSHNKQCLLNYTKFINVLFHGTYDENSTEKSFKCHLRDAIKLVKNRYFKEKCILSKERNATKDFDTSLQ